MDVSTLNAMANLLKEQKPNRRLAALKKQKQIKSGIRKNNKKQDPNFNWPNLPTQNAGTRRRKQKMKRTRKH
jgi:hypothetical protein